MNYNHEQPAIGIDIGGTNIKAGLVSGQEIIARIDEKTPGNLADFQTLLKKMVSSLSNGKSLPVGVALPGLLDSKKQKVIVSPNIPYLNSISFPDIYPAKSFANDVDMALFGELSVEPELRKENILLVNIGTGIGSAFFVNGHGSWELASSCGLGHTKVIPFGEICQCGGEGCVEAYSSGGAMIKKAKHEISPDIKDALELYQLWRKGDKRAELIIRKATHLLGVAIANAINCLDINKIILGGKISRDFDLFKEELRGSIAKNTFGYTQRSINVVQSKIIDQPSIIGAAFFSINK